MKLDYMGLGVAFLVAVVAVIAVGRITFLRSLATL